MHFLKNESISSQYPSLFPSRNISNVKISWFLCKSDLYAMALRSLRFFFSNAYTYLYHQSNSDFPLKTFDLPFTLIWLYTSVNSLLIQGKNIRSLLIPFYLKYYTPGTSLVVQWLRLHAYNAGAIGLMQEYWSGLIPVRELKFGILQNMAYIKNHVPYLSH